MTQRNRWRREEQDTGEGARRKGDRINAVSSRRSAATAAIWNHECSNKLRTRQIAARGPRRRETK